MKSREELLNVGMRTQELTLPDSGTVITVRQLPLTRAIELERMTEHTARAVFAAVHGIVGEDRKPLFTPDDSAIVGESFRPSDLIAVHNAVTELTAIILKKREVEADAKN